MAHFGCSENARTLLYLFSFFFWGHSGGGGADGSLHCLQDNSLANRVSGLLQAYMGE